MLATCIHMMQGTPYIYQGEELGMTNYPFSDIEELRDIESIDAFHRYIDEGRFTEEEMLKMIALKARDNARTPMQWSSDANGGFTHGEPWMNINPNYTIINAAEQEKRSDSVFHYYRRLIALRKDYDVITTGSYRLLDEENPYVFSYLRQSNSENLWVVCNFSGIEIKYNKPKCIKDGKYKLLICNYAFTDYLNNESLKPYEAIVWIER